MPITTTLKTLGFSGTMLLIFFWYAVPFANAYFYGRNVINGTHGMTGLRTPRLLLMFPFGRLATFLNLKH